MFAECEYWRLFHNFSVSEYAMIYWNRLILRADDSKEHTFESVDGWMHFYNGIATVKMAWLLSSYSSTKNWHSINFMNQKLQPFYTRPFKFRWLNSYMAWKSVEICPIRHLIYINDDQNSEELKFWQETNSHCCLKMSIKECFRKKINQPFEIWMIKNRRQNCFILCMPCKPLWNSTIRLKIPIILLIWRTWLVTYSRNNCNRNFSFTN